MPAISLEDISITYLQDQYEMYDQEGEIEETDNDVVMRNILQMVDISKMIKLSILFNERMYEHFRPYVQLFENEHGEILAKVNDSASYSLDTFTFFYLLQFWGCNLKMPIPSEIDNIEFFGEMCSIADQMWSAMHFPDNRDPILETFMDQTTVEDPSIVNARIYFIGGIMESSNRWLAMVSNS